MEKLYVGKIVNTFGLKGELKVLMDNYVELDEFFIDGYDEVFKCEKQVDKKGYVKIKMYAYDDINLVMQFIGKKIYAKNVAKVELQEDEYLVTDLVGSKLFDGQTEIGTITNVENFGATDIFVYEQNGEEHRVPFVLDFFEDINTKQKTIKVTKKFYEGAV